MAKFRFYRPEIWYVCVEIEADTEADAIGILVHGDQGDAEADMSDGTGSYVRADGANVVAVCADAACGVCAPLRPSPPALSPIADAIVRALYGGAFIVHDGTYHKLYTHDGQFMKRVTTPIWGQIAPYVVTQEVDGGRTRYTANTTQHRTIRVHEGER